MAACGGMTEEELHCDFDNRETSVDEGGTKSQTKFLLDNFVNSFSPLKFSKLPSLFGGVDSITGLTSDELLWSSDEHFEFLERNAEEVHLTNSTKRILPLEPEVRAEPKQEVSSACPAMVTSPMERTCPPKKSNMDGKKAAECFKWSKKRWENTAGEYLFSATVQKLLISAPHRKVAYSALRSHAASFQAAYELTQKHEALEMQRMNHEAEIRSLKKQMKRVKETLKIVRNEKQRLSLELTRRRTGFTRCEEEFNKEKAKFDKERADFNYELDSLKKFLDSVDTSAFSATN